MTDKDEPPFWMDDNFQAAAISLLIVAVGTYALHVMGWLAPLLARLRD